MTIIHTSDWHLGAKLHEQDRTAEHEAFLRWLAALADERRADAILVAGDIFDVRQPGPAAQKLYYDFLAAMDESATCRRIVVTAGNHDSASLLAAPGLVLRRLGVEVVARASEDVSRETVVLPRADGEPGLAVAAIPFMNDGELANFARAAGFGGEAAERLAFGFRHHCSAVVSAARAAAKGACVVAMGHCTVSGAAFSDERSERGRRIGGLDAHGLDAFGGADYVALGHLHVPQFVGGGRRAAYCGSPLKMSFAEVDGVKSVNVVRFGARAGEPPEVEPVATPVPVPLVRFEGSPDEIRRSLAAFASGAPASPVFACVRVTEGEGGLSDFWSEVDVLTQGTGAMVLLKENARPRAPGAAGLASAGAAALSAMTPLEVAALRIGEEADLSQEERAAYLEMVADALRLEIQEGGE